MTTSTQQPIKLTEAQRQALKEALLTKLQDDGFRQKLDTFAATPAAEGATREANPAAVAIAEDLQQDVTHLLSTLGLDGGAAADPTPDRPTVDAGRMPAADAPRRDAGEGGGMDFGGGADLDADLGLGMGATRGAGGESHGEQGQAMRYACEGCGQENEVLPPRGFRLVRAGEVQRHREAAGEPGDADLLGTAALDQLVTRLRRQLVAKEERFREASARERGVLHELIATRAKLHALELAGRAARALREARVPTDVLAVEDLVQYHPGQWASQIRMAQRLLEREARAGGTQYRGGAQIPAREGRQGSEPTTTTAVEAFDAAYTRSR